MGQLPSTDCDRMRAYVSASLDSELSQVEAVRLDSHLASCAGCRRYAVETGETARLLRGAPLEELDFAITLPSRRLAVARKLQISAAAAALFVTVGLSAVIGSAGSNQGSRSSSAAPVRAASLRFPEQELRMLHQASEVRLRLVIHSRFAA